MKKLISLILLPCFLISSVCSDLLHASLAPDNAAARPPVADSGLIPQSLGRITGQRLTGSRRLVINIQDLHCHPEVQKNIAGILARLNDTVGLKRVYVEGGYGPVDTSRLCNIRDHAVRKDILESMLARGVLTGSEYYSVLSGRPNLLKGIEDEAAHKANIVRLGRILEKKEYFTNRIKDLDRDLAFMQAKYFSRRQRAFDRLVGRHRSGAIPADKYYAYLLKYAGRINAEPDRYNGIASIDLKGYRHIAAYLDLSRRAKRLSYARASRQLQELLRELKSGLPYREYRRMQDATGSFTQLDELYGLLPSLAARCGIPLSRYPELQAFLEYTSLSRELNPVKLIEEDRRLTEEIRLGLSRNISELEVAFISDFYAYFKNYLLNAISADDYRYFSGRFEKFRLAWGKYAFRNRISGMARDFELLNEYYRVNTERNNSFIRNIEELSAAPDAAAAAPRPSPSLSLSEELKKAEIVVVVTGGFHTDGLRELLARRGISCLTVTPAVTRDAGAAGAVYERSAREQARMLSQALQLELASQLSSPALFELAVAAASDRLRSAGRGERDQLFADLKASMGVQASYDPADGVITFDSGAKVRLTGEKGSVSIQAVSPAAVLSPAVRASLEAVADTAGFSAAVARGDVHETLKAVMSCAANHYLITGSGLPYAAEADPRLRSRDVIDGIQKEILARFPDSFARAVVEHQLRTIELDEIAQRAGWLKVLLSLDLLRPFIPAAGQSAAAVPEPALPDPFPAPEGFYGDIKLIRETNRLSNADIRHVTDSYIPKKTAAGMEELRAERIRQFFSGLVVTENKFAPREKFLASGAVPRERVQFINKLIGNVYVRAQRSLGDDAAARITGEIRTTLDMLYRRMPDSVFIRFYCDTGMLPAHSLEHALNVVERICDILSVESDEVIANTDYTALVRAALSHDVSYMVFKDDHEANSALWFGYMLASEGNSDAALREKIATISRGHAKVRDNAHPRVEHGFFETRLLHDADLMDALTNGNERIFEINTSSTGEPLLRETLTPADRLSLFEKADYARGDGLTELMRKAWVQRDPKFFLTAGARAQIVLTRAAGLQSLLSFLISKKYVIREKGNDLQRVLDTVNEMFKLSALPAGQGAVTPPPPPAKQARRSLKFETKLFPGKVIRIVRKLSRPETWSAARNAAWRRALIEPRVFASAAAVEEFFSDLKQETPAVAEKMQLYPEIDGYLHPVWDRRDGRRALRDEGHLFFHVIDRCFGQKLRGLEEYSMALFQKDTAISAESFLRDTQRLKGFERTAMMPYFRAALLYHDIAKGAIETGDDVDRSITNEASARILRSLQYQDVLTGGILENMHLGAAPRQKEIFAKLGYQLISMRGYPGQFIRGELNYEVFAPYTEWIQKHWDELRAAIAPDHPEALPQILSDMHYLFNMIDASSVRDGLWNEDMRSRYLSFFADFRQVITPDSQGKFPVTWALVRTRVVQSYDRPSMTGNFRAELAARLLALRRTRIDAGEPAGRAESVINGLSEREVLRLRALFEHFKGWYVEVASSCLSPESQLKLIAIAASLAESKGININKPYHMHMGELARDMVFEHGGYDPEKVRRVEELLQPVPLTEILIRKGAALFDAQQGGNTAGGLSITMDGGKAIHVNFAAGTGGTAALPRTEGEAESLERLVAEGMARTDDGTLGYAFSRPDSSLVLPGNRGLAAQWKAQGQSAWWIAYRMATLEYAASLKPVKFYRLHYRGIEAYRGGHIRRAFGVAAITLSLWLGRSLGFITHLPLGIRRASAAAVRWGMKLSIAVHAVYDFLARGAQLVLPSGSPEPDAALIAEIVSLGRELQEHHAQLVGNRETPAAPAAAAAAWSLYNEQVKHLNARLKELGHDVGVSFLENPDCDVDACINALFGDTAKMEALAQEAGREYRYRRGIQRLVNDPAIRKIVDDSWTRIRRRLDASLAVFTGIVDYPALLASHAGTRDGIRRLSREYRGLRSGSVFGYFDWLPLVAAVWTQHEKVPASRILRSLAGGAKRTQWDAVEAAVAGLEELGMLGASGLSAAAAEKVLTALGYSMAGLEGQDSVMSGDLLAGIDMAGILPKDRIHVLRGPAIPGIDSSRFITYLTDDKGGMHVYLHQDALRELRIRDMRHSGRGYMSNALAVVLLHEVLEHAGLNHDAVVGMGVGLEALDELYREYRNADEIRGQLKDAFRAARRAIRQPARKLEAAYIEMATLDAAAPKDTLQFSTSRLTLEEAQAGCAGPAVWHYQGTFAGVKEFQNRAGSHFFERDVFVPIYTFISEMFLKAYAAANGGKRDGGVNPVRVEAVCFKEMVRIRFVQPDSSDEGWGKLVENQIRFRDNEYALRRFQRKAGSSFRTNHGVGLDRMGEILQDREKPALVRYIRETGEPHALVTEVYIRSASGKNVPSVPYRGTLSVCLNTLSSLWQISGMAALQLSSAGIAELASRLVSAADSDNPRSRELARLLERDVAATGALATGGRSFTVLPKKGFVGAWTDPEGRSHAVAAKTYLKDGGYILEIHENLLARLYELGGQEREALRKQYGDLSPPLAFVAEELRELPEIDNLMRLGMSQEEALAGYHQHRIDAHHGIFAAQAGDIALTDTLVSAMFGKRAHAPLSAEDAAAQMEAFLAALETGRARGYQDRAAVDLRQLPAGKEIILVGDLHTRLDNLSKILNTSDNLARIRRGDAVLVILGDAVHSETNFSEMTSSIEIMQCIMQLKIQAPESVYYILGNHDLARDVGKHDVNQGRLFRRTLVDLYGEKYLELYDRFLEKSPVMAVGNGFVAVHGGPAKQAVGYEGIRDASVVEGNSLVNDLLWGRLDAEMYRYTADDAKRFLADMGQPEGELYVGHSPQSAEDWSWNRRDAHQVTIFGAHDEVGYVSLREGVPQFVEVTRASSITAPLSDTMTGSAGTPIDRAERARWALMPVQTAPAAAAGVRPDETAVLFAIMQAEEIQRRHAGLAQASMETVKPAVAAAAWTMLNENKRQLADRLNKELGRSIDPSCFEDPACDVAACVAALFGDTARMESLALETANEYQFYRGAGGLIRSNGMRDQVEKRWSGVKLRFERTIAPFIPAFDWNLMLGKPDEVKASVRKICIGDRKLMLPRSRRLAGWLRGKGLPESAVQTAVAVVEFPWFVPLAFLRLLSELRPSDARLYAEASMRWIRKHGAGQSAAQVLLRRTGTGRIVDASGGFVVGTIAGIAAAPSTLLFGGDFACALALAGAAVSVLGVAANVREHVRWNLMDGIAAYDARLMLDGAVQPDSDEEELSPAPVTVVEDDSAARLPEVYPWFAARIKGISLRDFSAGKLLAKIEALLAYDGMHRELVRKAVLNTMTGILEGMDAGEAGASKVFGLSGEISGLYELIVKRGTTLEKIDLGNLRALNEIVSDENRDVVKEFDAVSSNTVFEFKFHLTLHKLYQQVVGLGSARMPHLKVLTDYPDYAAVRNLVYFGESDYGDVGRAIEAFVRARPEYASRVAVTDAGGLSLKLSLEEMKGFLFSQTTIDLVRDEERRQHKTFLPSDFEKNHRFTEAMIDRKLAQLNGAKFDVIIAVSNVPDGLLRNIRKLVGRQPIHAAFGIAMNASLACGAADIENRRRELVSGYDAENGVLPPDFELRQVAVGDGSINVLVHRRMLERLGDNGSLQNLLNRCFLDRPGYERERKDFEQKILAVFSGRPLIIDVLDRTPSLYGNCVSDGYVYVNENAPRRLDAIGISHELLHEAGIFTPEQEAELAASDFAAIMEAGLFPVLEAVVESGISDAEASPLAVLCREHRNACAKLYAEDFDGKPLIIEKTLEQEIAASGLDRVMDRETGISSWETISRNAGGIRTVYEFLDSLDDYARTGAYLLGRSSMEYEAIFKISGIKNWIEAHEEFFGNRLEQTDRFMDLVCADAEKHGKPVIFMVPPGMGEERGSVTAREMAWLLRHPEQMKRVIFVFGAYKILDDHEYVQRFVFRVPSYTPEQKLALIGTVLLNYRRHLPGGTPAASEAAGPERAPASAASASAVIDALYPGEAGERQLWADLKEAFVKDRVEKVDRLEIEGNVLFVGAGPEASYPAACALRGCSVDVVQPLIYQGLGFVSVDGNKELALVPIEQTRLLEGRIEKIGERTAAAFGSDLVGGRIDTKSYQGVISDVSLPREKYAAAFLVRVLNDPSVRPMAMIRDILPTLQDRARLIIGDSDDVYNVDRLPRDFAASFGGRYALTKKRVLDSLYPALYEFEIERLPGSDMLPENGQETAAPQGAMARQPADFGTEAIRAAVMEHVAAASAGLARLILAAHALWDRGFGVSKARVVYHVADSGSLAGALRRYPGDGEFAHVWFTDLADGSAGPEALPLGPRVALQGNAAQAPVWVDVKAGALVFSVDLSGVTGLSREQALSAAAAQVTALLRGTDLVKGDAALALRVRRIAASRKAAGYPDYRTPVFIDHFGNAEGVKQALGETGIHTAAVFPAAGIESASPETVRADIRKRLVRQKAWDAVWAENRILSLDAPGLSGFVDSLKVFNEAGNGQMLVSWEKVFQTSLDQKKISEKKIRSLLENARKHGVAVHCEYDVKNAAGAAAVRRLFSLGFHAVSLDLTALYGAAAAEVLKELEGYPVLAVNARPGVETAVHRVAVRLDTVEGMSFGPDDVLDIEIPAHLSLEEIRSRLRRLPLSNTMIFHSRDAAAISGSTRDITDKRFFASLIAILQSCGNQRVTTAAQARRLAMNWDAGDLPVLSQGEARKTQLQALSAGDMSGSGLSVNTALYDEAAQIEDPGLKAAFLAGIAARMLIVEKLRRSDAALAAAYVSGAFKFSDPLQEDLLGEALLKTALMDPAAAGREALDARQVKALTRATAREALVALYAETRKERPQSGSYTAVAEMILLDILVEHRIRQKVTYTPGKLETGEIKALLSAA